MLDLKCFTYKNKVDEEMKQGAELFASLKQLLKMYTRQRDKAMMLSVIEEVKYIIHPLGTTR